MKEVTIAKLICWGFSAVEGVAFIATAGFILYSRHSQAWWSSWVAIGCVCVIEIIRYVHGRFDEWVDCGMPDVDEKRD